MHHNRTDESMVKNLLVIMTDKEFRRLGEFISAECGIKMPPTKKIMLETRLRKRLRHHKMSSFKEYCEYLFSPDGMKKELIHMPFPWVCIAGAGKGT